MAVNNLAITYDIDAIQSVAYDILYHHKSHQHSGEIHLCKSICNFQKCYHSYADMEMVFVGTH